MAKLDNLGKLLLRLSVAAVVLFHGVSKMAHGVEWIKGPLGAVGLPGFLAYGAYAGEVLAPILLIAGYRSRAAALVVAFDLLMAIFLVLRSHIFAVKEMGGGWAIELEALIVFGSLAIFCLGGGRYSLTGGGHRWD